MISTVIAVAVGIISTTLALFLAGLAFGHHRRQALRYWKLESRLPDAVRYEDLQARIASLESDYDALRERRFDAEQTLEEAARKQQWMETVREEIATLEQQRLEVERIQNELETKQVTLADLHEKCLKQEKECDTLAELERSLRRQIDDLRHEQTKLEAIKKEVAELSERKRKAENEIESLTRKAARLKDDLESELRSLKRKQDENLAEQKRKADEELAHFQQNASRQKDELEAKLRALSRECDDAKIEKERKKNQLDEFDKRIADLGKREEEIKREHRQLSKDVKELEGKKSSLSAQIPTLEATFSQLSSTLERQTAVPELSKSELWSPVLKATAERSARPDELDVLKEVSKSIERRGLRFDLRTLHAFHTALKSTSSSPLVTLAGVSGTGKSELPRCYADALGINFLGIAVQPRWDSPQDLFGFYDYLEQRFRPTELTRALLQLDPVGARSDRGWDCPNGYMQARVERQLLLVLLDEMNLARVEYYFSEFLSKLETRRGVDLKDANQRSRAEVVLDVSGRAMRQQPLRLYVGANVLFVGTMNEDESTQSLSDKVIDRSNVLRFGSPRTISPLRPTLTNGDSKPIERLRYEHWQGWCKTMHDLEDTHKQQLLDWIRQIREALDAISRPFAYRVANAILEYAANYPEVENRIEYAMADQIEQRVLPKLIGLDLHQAGSGRAISSISQVLNQIGDDKLREQLEKNRHDDYFQWTGLDRTAVS